jgi:hypothetical protein
MSPPIPRIRDSFWLNMVIFVLLFGLIGLVWFKYYIWSIVHHNSSFWLFLLSQ